MPRTKQRRRASPGPFQRGSTRSFQSARSSLKSAIPDPHNVEIYLTVNDKVQQNDSTNLMLFQIPRMLSDISKVMTLEKGDIVITGTPKGVGSVVPGDIMRAGIKVEGREIEEGKIEVGVEESTSTYQFAET